jgi:uncharacterized protein involved in exopolysaccharide biosynthesis
VLAGVLIGAGAAGLIALRQPNQYAATATLARGLPASATGKSMFDAPPPNWDPLRTLALTDIVGFRVREKLQMTRDATDSLPTPVQEAFPSSGGLLTLRVTTTNFAYAKDFVTAWASELVDLAKAQRRGQVSTARASSEQQLLSLERQHEQAVVALDNFRTQQDLAPGSDPWAGVETTVTRLQQDLLALDTRKALPSEFQDAQSGRLLDLQFEVRRLENRLGNLPTGTATEAKAGMEAELKARQADLRSFQELLADAHKAELSRLDARRQALTGRLQELRRQLTDAADTRRQLAALERQEQIVAEVLDGLQRESVALGKVAVDEEEFMVVQAGMGSGHAVGPDRTRTVARGGGAGALAGLVLGAVWRRWRRRRA